MARPRTTPRREPEAAPWVAVLFARLDSATGRSKQPDPQVKAWRPDPRAPNATLPALRALHRTACALTVCDTYDASWHHLHQFNLGLDRYIPWEVERRGRPLAEVDRAFQVALGRALLAWAPPPSGPPPTWVPDP